jgi:hypothetical protein
MNGFKDYHKSIKTHVGNGQLVLQSGDVMNCFFKFSQYADGSMRLDCSVPTNGIVQVAPNRRGPIPVGLPGEFNGMTGEGLVLEVTRAFVIGLRFSLESRRAGDQNQTGTDDEVEDENSQCPIGAEAGVRMEFGLALSVVSAVVGKPGQLSFKHLRYGLTNLSFEPSEFASIAPENESIRKAAQLPLEIEGLRLALRPVANYDEVLAALAATHGVDVTCEAIVPVESLVGLSRPEELEEIDNKINRLCILLTLATGTRVRRYGLDFVGDNGEVVMSFLQQAVTSRFNPHPFSQPVAAENLKDFVEQAFPLLPQMEQLWGIDEVISSYIDAREGNLLTAIGVKLSVCMEVLKAQFLKRSMTKDYVVPDKLFSRALKKGLREELRQVLRVSLCEARTEADKENFDDEFISNAVEAMINAGKPKELNRRTFSDVLGEMCESVGFEVSEDVRNRFVRIRNFLVHEGTFPDALGEAYQQCQFLNDFVGGFLLAIFGVRSDEIDATVVE